MAKEYFKVKSQVIEFDDEAHTMTVTMHEDKFSVVSIQRMTENEFNSQYFMFKSNIFRGMSLKNENPMGLTSEDALRIEHTPVSSSVETFIEVRDLALNVINTQLQSV
jgi:hypothetical protein